MTYHATRYETTLEDVDRQNVHILRKILLIKYYIQARLSVQTVTDNRDYHRLNTKHEF